MRVKSITVKQFKRFTDLTITDIPESARLIVLVGPNGSGKSAVFEALNFWAGRVKGGRPSSKEYVKYFVKIGTNHAHPTRSINDLEREIVLEFHEEVAPNQTEIIRKAVYVRSAYRVESRFISSGINKREAIDKDPNRPQTLADTDVRVSDNYARIVASAVESVFSVYDDDPRKSEIREELIGRIRESMMRVFSDLTLRGIGNPLDDGTFLFEKGDSVDFEYQNLSGGEKSAFDLILDLAVKTRVFDNTVFCIDEPELHMHSKLQAILLDEMYRILPQNCQLWIATHSAGMLRKAVELHQQNPGNVVFLDFGGHDFDNPVALKPVLVGRQFWKNTLAVALGDLAELTAPSQIVLCEGRIPDRISSRSFDAEIYNRIFHDTYPDTEFISVGGDNEIGRNALLLEVVLSKVLSGVKVWRVLDRDDRSDEERETLLEGKTSTLRRRDLENYLWDDEILEKLCREENQLEKWDDISDAKSKLMAELVKNHKPDDDIKAISGQLYNNVKRILNLRQCGNNSEEFAKATLAPLITPDTQVYMELERDIFGTAS